MQSKKYSEIVYILGISVVILEKNLRILPFCKMAILRANETIWGGNLSFYTTQKRRTKPIKKVVISKLSHITLYAFENYKLHFEVII